MYTVLILYTQSRRKEIRLEDDGQGIQEIGLPQRIKGQKFTLYVEKEKDEIKIKEHVHFDFFRNGVLCQNEKLYPGDMIEVVWNCKVIVTLILQKKAALFGNMKKYEISSLQEISIGSDPLSTICYNFRKLVSRKHGVCERRCGKWYIKDYGLNGIYVNGERLKQEKALGFGDKITIFGCTIFFFGEVIAVESDETVSVRGIPNFRNCTQLQTFTGKKESCRISFVSQPEWTKTPQGETEKQIRIEKTTGTLWNIWDDFFVQNFFIRKKSLEKKHPSAEACCGFTKENFNIWKRNSKQEDFLSFRLGKGGYGKNIICLDFAKHAYVGIVEQGNAQGSILQNILIQIMANISNRDVRIGVLAEEKQIEKASILPMIKYIPHIWNDAGKKRTFAQNKQEAKYVLKEIEKSISEKDSYDSKSPTYFLFVQGTRDMMEEYERSSLRKYAQRGLITCFFGDNFEILPDYCEQILEDSEKFRGMYNLGTGRKSLVPIQFDTVKKKDVFALVQRLSRYSVQISQHKKKIPSKLTFFELYGIKQVEKLGVENKWKRNRCRDGICAKIGKGKDNQVNVINIHENFHGPHGMIAGETGSGKSELIQTLLLSLMIQYSPQEINIVLIDYKGGGMSQLFQHMPHVVGTLTNLSRQEAKRAIFALKNEIVKRQKAFENLGVCHIDQYSKKVEQKEDLKTISHLCIVVDEFAELKRENPDFLQELIRISQVGRSLGLHLLLATQKPAGTVDANIWSNSRFRICLKVREEQDSLEMIKTIDATKISNVGRAFLQVGNEELYEELQTGWTGAGCKKKFVRENEVMLIDSMGNEILPSVEAYKDCQKETQLDTVCMEICTTAKRLKLNNKEKLWLPSLSTEIVIEELEQEWLEKRKKESGEKISVPIGMYDDIFEQKQEIITVTLDGSGHFSVLGNLGSGKTNLLQILLYELVKHYTPEQINIYLVDSSACGFQCLQEAPLIGEIVKPEEGKRLEKLFAFLLEEIKQRKEMLKGWNYWKIEQQEKFPVILLVIDDMAGYREKTKDAYGEQLEQIIREGLNYGIHVVLSAGGFGPKEIPSFWQKYIRHRMVLGYQDAYEYKEWLGAKQISVLPKEAKGRGMICNKEQAVEVQTAVLKSLLEIGEQKEFVIDFCRRKKEEWKGKQVKKIPLIPQDAIFSEFSCMEEYEKKLAQGKLPIGYDMKNGTITSVSLEYANYILISGAYQTGKANLAKIIMGGIRKKRGKIVVIGSEKRKLEQETEKNQGIYIRGLLEMKEWLKKYQKEKAENFETVNEKSPVYLFIEHMPSFLENVYEKKEYKEICQWLEMVIRKKENGSMYWIGICNVKESLACKAYPFFQEFLQKSCGCYLGGKLWEQQLFSFNDIDYRQQRKEEKAGICYVKDEKEETRRILLPLVK